jgi:hypothetical protein
VRFTIGFQAVGRAIEHCCWNYLQVGFLQVGAETADFIVCVAHGLSCSVLTGAVELFLKSLCVGELPRLFDQSVFAVHAANQVRWDLGESGYGLGVVVGVVCPKSTKAAAARSPLSKSLSPCASSFSDIAVNFARNSGECTICHKMSPESICSAVTSSIDITTVMTRVLRVKMSDKRSMIVLNH